MDTSEAEKSIAIKSSNGAQPEMSLSPVHIINFDVLSIIFLLAWETQEGSQLVVASVCRRWREIVLSTPRVWTRIPYTTSQNEERVRLFLFRSRPLPLHLMIAYQPRRNQQEPVLEETERIQCLTLSPLHDTEILVREFPILRRLEIWMAGRANIEEKTVTSNTGLLDVTRYPMLSELHIKSSRSSLLCDIEKSPSFPPLQVLSIVCRGDNSWFQIIQKCATTLTSLTMLIGNVQSFGNVLRFAFPSLRHLSVSETSTASAIQLSLEVPLLQSVQKVLHARRTPRVTFQLSKGQDVTDLHLLGLPFEFAPYPRLRTLWIEDRLTDIQARILSLPDAISHCPELQSIRYRCIPSAIGAREEEDQLRLLIVEALKDTPRAISIEEFTPKGYQPTGSTLRKECEGMLCRRWCP